MLTSTTEVPVGTDARPSGGRPRPSPDESPLPAPSVRQAKLAVLTADTVATVLGLAAATGLWHVLVRRAGEGGGRYVAIAAASVPVWLAAYALKRLYLARFFLRIADEVRRIAGAATSAAIAIALVAFALKQDLSRGWLLLAWCCVTATMVVNRWFVRLAFRRRRASGQLSRPVVIVGLNLEGLELRRTLQEDPALGYEVLGFVDDDPVTAVPGVEILGEVRHTVDIVRRVGAQGVLVAATALDLEQSNRLIRDLVDAGIHVQLSSTLRDIATYRLTVQPLGRFPVVYVEPVARGGWRRAAKRAFDLAFALGGLLVCAPVLLLCALAIRLDSPGPVLFRQERVGRDGRRFQVLKLRTMVRDAEDQLDDLQGDNESDGPLFKMQEDPRATRVGRLLRRMSLDELPQLWNVVRDDMSIVGPRPALPSEVALWEPELHNRLRVKPGITGMWQVHGRSSASFAEYVRLDLYYVDNWSLLNDLAIVAKTVPAVLLRRGAY